jgi:Transmembrane domain of unknown function (DUF3566)
MPVDPSGVTTDDHGSAGDGREHGPAAPGAPAYGQVGGNGRPGSGDRATHTAATEGQSSIAGPTREPAETTDAASDSAAEVAGLGSFVSAPPAPPDSRVTTDATSAAGTVDVTAEPALAPGLEDQSSADPTAADDTTGEESGIAAAAAGAGAVVGSGLERLRSRRRAQHVKKARRGLRVKQRLWSIDPWSVFKVSALFYICLCLIVLVAGTLLWNVGRSAGTVDEVESFVTRMGAYGTCTLKAEVPAGTEFETDDDCAEGEVLVGGFQVDDGALFRMAAIGGGVLVVAGSIGNVLMVVLLNLLNELTGGLRYTIVKEPQPHGSRGGPPRGAPGQRAGPRRRLAANGSLAQRTDG